MLGKSVPLADRLEEVGDEKFWICEVTTSIHFDFVRNQLH